MTRACAAGVLVHWTTDPVEFSRINGTVAHYLKQGELTKAMLAGFDAFDAGRLKEAVREWGCAVRLATESANTEALTRLSRLVDLVDATKGIVRLKPNVSRIDVISSASGADMSTRSGAPSRRHPENRDAAAPVTAPCGHQGPSTARFCGTCGEPVNGPGR